MNLIISVLLQTGAIVLLVDFASGVLHWLEDSYASEKTPLFGRLVVTPNVIHHRDPRRFTKSPFWRRNGITMLLGGIVLLSFGTLFGASWQLWLFSILGGISNEIHCWAHRSSEENGRLIALLHRLRILQAPAHHAAHHADPKNRAYCILTNVMNPALDRIGFWRGSEALIRHLFHVHPRPDPSVSLPGMAAIQRPACPARIIPTHPRAVMLRNEASLIILSAEGENSLRSFVPQDDTLGGVHSGPGE